MRESRILEPNKRVRARRMAWREKWRNAWINHRRHMTEEDVMAEDRALAEEVARRVASGEVTYCRPPAALVEQSA